MVLREETMLQVKTKVSQMEKASDINVVKDFIGVPLHSSAPVLRTKSEIQDTERMNACMANNLFHSVFKGRFRKVKLILDRGYNINNKNNYGYSVLIAALHLDDDEKRDKMFRYLINRHADIAAKDPKHGRSVLSWASLLGRNPQVILILDSLKGDFDLTEQDNDGMTALHHATQAGHPEVVRTLVDEFRRFRISVDVVDKLGLTPYLHAKRLGYNEISNILHTVGRACPGQSDSYTFRSSKEWSDIGANMKLKQQLQKRYNHFEQAAIHGSSKSFRGFFDSESVPSVSVSAPSDSQRSEKMTFWVVKNVPPKYRTANDKYNKYSNDYEDHRHSEGSRSVSRANPTFSLLELTPGAKAISANEFKHSEIDTSKLEPVKTTAGPKHQHHQHSHHAQRTSQLQSLGAIMNALADQQTSSYRQPVKVTPPEEPITLSRAKRSTFSIIFGKDGDKKKKKKGKASAKSSRSSKKKGCNSLKPPSRT